MLCTFHNKCLTAHYIRPKFLLTLKNKKTDEKGARPTDIFIPFVPKDLNSYIFLTLYYEKNKDNKR